MDRVVKNPPPGPLPEGEAVRVEPPIEHWPAPWRDRPIATGHQAYLWHPGILAKYIAMRAACDRLDAHPLHLVVDSDAHEALTLQLPVIDGDRLEARTLQLAPHDPNVPTGWQPPAEVETILRTLRAETSDDVLIEAFIDLPTRRTLAEQVAAVLSRLMRPYVGEIPIVMASDLCKRFDFDTLLRDARPCAEAYNRAVLDHPSSDVATLRIERDRVELPMWAIAWRQPRRRVFVDLSDSTPIWVFDDGEPIDRRRYDLASKALLLTAIMRSTVCGLFIHGTGGGDYDRATERWWRTWRGQELAPMAMVTADVTLDFDLPVADPAELDRAVWYRRHLSHNVDRALGEPDPRKRALFNVKGKTAFDELHRINDGLVTAHPELIADADRAVQRARLGIANARVALKRDWCFGLYPPEKLEALRDAICRTIPA